MPKGQHAWFTPENKISIIQKYYSSNQTVEKFCEVEGISKATLYKWLKIYNDANTLPVNTFQDITPIIKQEVAPIIKSTIMKLRLSNSMVLEFESSELHNVLMELK